MKPDSYADSHLPALEQALNRLFQQYPEEV